jgi:hypothetical protein
VKFKAFVFDGPSMFPRTLGSINRLTERSSRGPVPRYLEKGVMRVKLDFMEGQYLFRLVKNLRNWSKNGKRGKI